MDRPKAFCSSHFISIAPSSVHSVDGLAPESIQHQCLRQKAKNLPCRTDKVTMEIKRNHRNDQHARSSNPFQMPRNNLKLQTKSPPMLFLTGLLTSHSLTDDILAKSNAHRQHRPTSALPPPKHHRAPHRSQRVNVSITTTKEKMDIAIQWLVSTLRGTPRRSHPSPSPSSINK